MNFILLLKITLELGFILINNNKINLGVYLLYPVS